MTAVETVAVAGLLAGTLDITATSTLFALQGISVERLWQTIASGALGSSAFSGGKKAAAAGLFFHFVIALTVAAVYYALSRSFPLLIERPLVYGVIYGAVVHLVMSRIVLPLSAAPKRVFSTKAFLIQLVIHICFVGVPIALVVSRFPW
jgi:tetrahydromethanopterin S-methyltransferase subunit G